MFDWIKSVDISDNNILTIAPSPTSLSLSLSLSLYLSLSVCPSLSLSLSLYIYIYIYIYNFFLFYWSEERKSKYFKMNRTTKRFISFIVFMLLVVFRELLMMLAVSFLVYIVAAALMGWPVHRIFISAGLRFFFSFTFFSFFSFYNSVVLWVYFYIYIYIYIYILSLYIYIYIKREIC